MSTHTITCPSFEELKLRGREFFELAPTANENELEGLIDAFSHSFLNCDYPETERGEIDRTMCAPMLLKIITRKYFELKENFA